MTILDSQLTTDIQLENVSWDTYELLLRDTSEQHVRMTFNKGMLHIYATLPIYGIEWETYEALLHDTQEQHVRITYDDGRIWFMSPLPIHDKIKKAVGRLIETASLELNIEISSFGSTTWRRKRLKKGLEPDECYYFQSEPLVRGRTDIDLKKDPPPDLAVEVDITHGPIERLRIYVGLGVGEVWRYDGEQFEFLLLDANGKAYVSTSSSRALPFMTPEVIDRFVAEVLKHESAGVRAFRDWLRSLPGVSRGK